MLLRRPASMRPFGTRQVQCSRVMVRASTVVSTEAAALSKYKCNCGEGLEPCIKLLKQAAADKSVNPEVLEGALAYLEQNQTTPASRVEGRWRLVFSTATSSRIMQYIPVQEDFVIQLVPQLCALESAVGPFSFNIRGNITGWNSATGAMDFQFNAVDVILFGKQIWQANPKTKPKTYTFFFEGGGIAAARSSAGGLSLLRQ